MISFFTTLLVVKASKFSIPKLLFILGLFFFGLAIVVMILGIVNGAQGANIGFGMVMMVAVLFWLVALIGLLITKSKINRPLVLFLIVALGWFLFGLLVSLLFFFLFPPVDSCPLYNKNKREKK